VPTRSKPRSDAEDVSCAAALAFIIPSNELARLHPQSRDDEMNFGCCCSGPFLRACAQWAAAYERANRANIPGKEAQMFFLSFLP